jgi:hypothetical protein
MRAECQAPARPTRSATGRPDVWQDVARAGAHTTPSTEGGRGLETIERVRELRALDRTVGKGNYHYLVAAG